MNIPRSVLFLDAAGGDNGAAAARLLTNMGGGAVQAHSADPGTWDAFAGNGAPPLDVVVTLSNDVVGEVCAVFWTGRPVTTHWPVPDDPAAAQTVLAAWIAAFLDLPFAEITQIELQARLDAIGRN